MENYALTSTNYHIFKIANYYYINTNNPIQIIHYGTVDNNFEPESDRPVSLADNLCIKVLNVQGNELHLF